MWIVRDKDNMLYMYDDMPHLDKDGEHFTSDTCDPVALDLDKSEFPWITFELSPVKVENAARGQESFCIGQTSHAHDMILTTDALSEAASKKAQKLDKKLGVTCDTCIYRKFECASFIKDNKNCTAVSRTNEYDWYCSKCGHFIKYLNRCPLSTDFKTDSNE